MIDKIEKDKYETIINIIREITDDLKELNKTLF